MHAHMPTITIGVEFRLNLEREREREEEGHVYCSDCLLRESREMRDVAIGNAICKSSRPDAICCCCCVLFIGKVAAYST